jgi:hypothetical protein
LQRLIEAGNGGLRLWDAHGNQTNAFPGDKPLHLAPSGLRLLAGNSWLDMETGQSVTLADWQPAPYAKPGWSADERRVFACCFNYADLGSGQSWFQSEFPGFFIGGRGSWPGEEAFSRSHWVANDSRVMIDPLAIWFIADDDPHRLVVPLFDPASQTYTDLVTQLGLELPGTCWGWPAPGGAHAWVECLVQQENQMVPHHTAYLIDLQAMRATPVEGGLEFRSWSPDGRFAVSYLAPATHAEAGATWLFTPAGLRRQAADAAAIGVHWRETQPVAALRFEDRRLVRIFPAEGLTPRDLAMDQPVVEFAWQPGRLGIALATEDGRVWWVANASDARSAPVEVAPAMPGLHSLRWSPDGRRLAFVHEDSVYIVTIE